MFNCENLCYPEEPIYHINTFSTTGITLKEQHHIRARYYIERHQPPASLEEIQELCPDIPTINYTAMVHLKKEIYPKWQLTEFQKEVVEQHLEELNKLNRCPICTLIKGAFCNNPLRHQPCQAQAQNRRSRQRNRNRINPNTSRSSYH